MKLLGFIHFHKCEWFPSFWRNSRKLQPYLEVNIKVIFENKFLKKGFTILHAYNQLLRK